MKGPRNSRRSIAIYGASGPAAGRLRLFGWRARRGWLPRSALWALLPAPPDGALRRLDRADAWFRVVPRPALSRVARLNLDLAFRGRGEAALLHVAYAGRLVARVAFRAGVILVGASLAVVLMLPVVPVLMTLAGFMALGLAAAAGCVALLAGIPARATRTLRLRRWLAPGAPSTPADGDRVCLRGRIVPLRLMPALDGSPAVFQRVRATKYGRGAELQKGEDFLLDDGRGAPVRVRVEHGLLVDRPARVQDPWLSPPIEVFPFLPGGPSLVSLEEAILLAGDEIEVSGRIETVVDPAAADRLERTTPVVRTLSGTPEEPLLLSSRPPGAPLRAIA